MEKQSSTYWSIIRGEIKSGEHLEQEIQRENIAQETAQQLRDLFELQNLSNELAGMHHYRTEIALSKVTGKIRSIESKRPFIYKLYKPWVVAASVFLIIALAGLHQYFFRTVQYSNNTDHGLAILLSDFSEVILAPQSKLEVNRYYGLINRNLHLDGDAFFNVSTNPGKAFNVKTDECDITVLGTQFYVVDDTEGLRVDLLEGKLMIEGKSGEQHVLVNSGAATIDKGKITALDNSSIPENAWIGEPMVCEDMPLADIIEMINGNYGGEIIRIEPNVRMNECRVHTVIYPGKIGDFINEMEVLFEIKYRKYKGTFVIDEINCNG